MMTVVVVASAVFARFLFVLRLDYAVLLCFFFFNDTATTEIYTLSLHDALPISAGELAGDSRGAGIPAAALARPRAGGRQEARDVRPAREGAHRRRERDLGTVRRLGRWSSRAGRPERDFTPGEYYYRAGRRHPLSGSRPGERSGARAHGRRRALDLAGNPCRPAADYGGDPGQVRAADGEL